jgi:hypothetical protein
VPEVSALAPVRSSSPSADIDRTSSTTHKGFPPARPTTSASAGPGGRPSSAWTRASTSGCSRALSATTSAPDRRQSSSSRSNSAVRGEGRSVAISSTGTSVSWRVIHRNVSSVELSAQCKSSSATSTGPLSESTSSRSMISSTARNCSAPAGGEWGPMVASAANRRPIAARRGSLEPPGAGAPLPARRTGGSARADGLHRGTPSRRSPGLPRARSSAGASCQSPPRLRPAPSRPRRVSAPGSGRRAAQAHGSVRPMLLWGPASPVQPDR